MTVTKLRLAAPSAEQQVRDAIREYDALARQAAIKHGEVCFALRQLANERGLAFIRIEQARREFGL